MNLLLAFIALISVSFAGPKEISQKIATSYQSLMADLPQGDYVLNAQVTYNYNLGSIPVLLVPNYPVTVPSQVEDCFNNENSFPCQIAVNLTQWYSQTLPSQNGEFSIQTGVRHSNGAIIKKEIIAVPVSELH